jgi:type IV pilus assembly protein PilY1
MTGDVDMNGGIQDQVRSQLRDVYTLIGELLLVGTLGLGGKGYFVLGCHQPQRNTHRQWRARSLLKATQILGEVRSVPVVLTEPAPNCSVLSGAEQTTCLQTVDEDKDIGYITARPVRDDADAMRSTQITRMNNNRWAVVMGNGYNSTNQRAVLLVQYLDGAKELVRIPVTNEALAQAMPRTMALVPPALWISTATECLM